MKNKLYSVWVPSIVALGIGLASCCPGGTDCTKILVLGGPNRSPVSGAVLKIYRETDLVQPINIVFETGFEPGTYLTRAQCSGTTVVKITHPNFQPFQQTYTSPRDRSSSCNAQVDEVTYVLTPL